MTQSKTRYTVYFYRGPTVVRPEHYQTKAEAIRAFYRWLRDCHKKSQLPLRGVSTVSCFEAGRERTGCMTLLAETGERRKKFRYYARAYLIAQSVHKY